MAFGLLSRIKAQEGVKKLVVWDSDGLLLLTGCSSTLYLQENSKLRRVTKLSYNRAKLESMNDIHISHSPTNTF